MGLENPCLFLLSDDSSPQVITQTHRRSDTMSFMFGERSLAHLLKSITYPRKWRCTDNERERERLCCGATNSKSMPKYCTKQLISNLSRQYNKCPLWIRKYQNELCLAQIKENSLRLQLKAIINVYYTVYTVISTENYAKIVPSKKRYHPIIFCEQSRVP